VPRDRFHGTVLIDTILATFEMDEMRWWTEDHSAALIGGRWDSSSASSISSAIKDWSVLPDRAQVGMTAHFLQQLRPAADQDLPPAEKCTPWRHGFAESPSSNAPPPTVRPGAGARPTRSASAADGHDGTG